MEKTVLIVDDSNTNNLLLENILDSEGINTEIAFSGKEALKLLKIKKPSLILLDIMMPNIDGFDVLNIIKANAETKEIPVVFITAKNDYNIKQKAIDKGAADLIQKPIDINKVLEIVKQYILN